MFWVIFSKSLFAEIIKCFYLCLDGYVFWVMIERTWVVPGFYLVLPSFPDSLFQIGLLHSIIKF